QRGKPPEWWEKQKGSRGIRRGQWYRLVFQFPIRQVALVAPENVLFFHSPIQLYCAKQKVEFYLTARKICISLFYHSYIFIQTINFFLIIMIKVLIVNRCRASGMEGGTPLFHMIPE
ncbi:hypothetical protein ACRW1Q_24300, partial [Escherichia coli]